MAHPHAHERSDEVAKARHLISRTGYKRGGAVDGDEAQDRGMIARGVHEHEANMHKGEPKTKLRLASGGQVDGEKGRQHLAKRARGGATHKKGTKVNVIVMPQGGGGARPVPVPVPAGPRPVGAPAPAAAAPMPPPGAAPPMGAPMGGRPPGVPGGPMLRARGGKVPHMDAGAMSGPGRIQKPHEYGEGGFKPKKRMIHNG